MRMTRLAIAAVLGLVGLAWLGQGVGLIAGSAMSGNPIWAVIGGVLLVLAGVLMGRELRRR